MREVRAGDTVLVALKLGAYDPVEDGWLVEDDSDDFFPANVRPSWDAQHVVVSDGVIFGVIGDNVRVE